MAARAFGNRRSIVVLLVGALSGELMAQGNSSLSESNLEKADTQVAAGTVLSETEELRGQLAVQRESVRTLTESLAQ